MKNSKKVLAVFCAGIVLVCAISMMLSHWKPNSKNTFANVISAPRVIIDAGHGGMDSGAVSESGICEKDLNMAIAFKTRAIMKLFGIDSVMTRDSDISLGFKDGASVRTNKRSDLYFRTLIAKDYPNCDFISIHMNKFEQEKYYGAQVFYNKNPKAIVLAQETQKCLREIHGGENARKIKPAPNGVYITENISAPVIIAECGFLSNAKEAALLTQNNYQNKTSCAIAVAYINYLFAAE